MVADHRWVNIEAQSELNIKKKYNMLLPCP